MLKYLSSDVVAREVPDEISLAISITNCPFRCEGCHSPYLHDDTGMELTPTVLQRMIEDSKGVTCVVFLGGDSDLNYLVELCKMIKEKYNLKTAWYSGRSKIPDKIITNIYYFDYIKIGPYIKDRGGLDSPNTNQRMYQIGPELELIDVTKWYQKK